MSSEFQTEAAFRRGFHQGYEQALAHIVSCETEIDMHAHAEMIQLWREKAIQYGEGFVPPPEIGATKRRLQVRGLR
jgi:hypothetical protein